MSQTKVLIMAGGQEKRWGKYLGVHKHFLKVEGEPLVHRTVRLLRERIDAEINMVTFYEEYLVDGVKQIMPTALEEQTKLTSSVNDSAEHWATDARTIVLLGDVFFTDRAMDLICKFEGRGCTFFGRSKRSQYTGCSWQEIFGFTLLPEDHAEMKQAIKVAKQAYREGITQRCIGWEVYRALHDIPLLEDYVAGGFLEIDDFTEDFDFPLDYERWKRNYNNRKEKFWPRVGRRLFGSTG